MRPAMAGRGSFKAIASPPLRSPRKVPAERNVRAQSKTMLIADTTTATVINAERFPADPEFRTGSGR